MMKFLARITHLSLFVSHDGDLRYKIMYQLEQCRVKKPPEALYRADKGSYPTSEEKGVSRLTPRGLSESLRKKRLARQTPSKVFLSRCQMFNSVIRLVLVIRPVGNATAQVR